MNTLELQQVAKMLKQISDYTIVPHLDALQLTKAEAVVLSILTREDNKSISDITHISSLAQSQISTTITSLKKRGWVILRQDPTDARKRLVLLTPEVRKGAEQAFQRDATAYIYELLPELSSTEIAELIKSLEYLVKVTNRRNGRE